MVDRRAKKQELHAAVSSRDARGLEKAVNVPPSSTKKKSKQDGRRSPQPYQERLEEGGIDWSAVLSSLLDANREAEAGDAIKCYEAHASLHASFNHVFGSSSGNWMVPALHRICKNTHLIAVAADDQATEGGRKEEHVKLQNAVTLLQESYSKCYNDRKEFQPNSPLSEDGSKKAGVLCIVNQLFTIYFRLNTLRLCKNLLRPVETKRLHEQGCMGDMVTYRYYVGRLNMFEDQYEAAEQNLEYALQHCHKGSIRNKRCILRYLVPVKLYRGRVPSAQLLQKYSLKEFLPLVEGIRKGDLRTFNDGLVQFQDLFIRQGTYLLLEKCKSVCYRNLFKRIHLILERHQISLNQVAKAFKWLGIPIDLDEVECILANLIFRGHIRGYLSHAKRVLVLSKRDPFPPTAGMVK